MECNQKRPQSRRQSFNDYKKAPRVFGYFRVATAAQCDLTGKENTLQAVAQSALVKTDPCWKVDAAGLCDHKRRR